MPFLFQLSQLAVQMLGSMQGVFQQAGARHRANSAGYWSDPAGTLYGYIELDVPDQLAIGLAVDTDIDDDGAFLDPFAFDQSGNPRCYHDQIGPPDMLTQIMGETMGNGRGATSQQQLQGHRATDDIGCADNNGIEAVQIDAGAFQ